ncbi:E3 ubiquitin-protein ligase TRIM45-like [Ylistrum balloti]|uniref:E3 ubiquitin-protein ligase TRIM45-like n=1 Tax=Ylistrum balloti TaxID=509963 RepID=UPI002905BF0F|nr:E3 ubiquitin-protein ligase TRIM45-like [Ylistrum balloti]
MATPINQTFFHPKGQSTCSEHKGRQLDLYCEKCDQLICLTCMLTTHGSHPVCQLSAITPQKKQDIENFIEKTEQNDLVKVGEYITSADILLKDNTSNFEKLSLQLKTQTDKLKHELDLHTTQTLSIYKQMEEDNTRLIQKYKNELEMYDKQLKQQLQDCQVTLQRGSHLDIYDTEIYPSLNFPVKPVLGTTSFTPNTNPHHYLQQALGTVTTSGQTSIDQDRSVSAPDEQGQSSKQQQTGVKGKKAVTSKKLWLETIVMKEWESPCCISSVCPTTDGQVWTCNYLSDTLTLLNREGKVVQEVKHTAVINYISLSPTTHTLWVCDEKKNIMELASGQLTNKFRTKEFPRCICVTASNHIIVGMNKHISKFTTQGQMVLTTMTRRTRKPLLHTLYKMAECPVTHNVTVIDFNDESDSGDGDRHVVVMDADFQELFVYRGDIPSAYKQTPETEDELFNPWCVVYDSVGNLIIGDLSNCRVLLLSGGGEFLRIIYTEPLGAWEVGVDREDVLWVVFEDDNVKLLQYSSV